MLSSRKIMRHMVTFRANELYTKRFYLSLSLEMAETRAPKWVSNQLHTPILLHRLLLSTSCLLIFTELAVLFFFINQIWDLICHYRPWHWSDVHNMYLRLSQPAFRVVGHVNNLYISHVTRTSKFGYPPNSFSHVVGHNGVSVRVYYKEQPQHAYITKHPSTHACLICKSANNVSPHMRT